MKMRKKQREFHVVIERDEDGYLVADVPELPGCHTQAKTLDTLMKRVHEAIVLYLGAKVKQPMLEFVGIQRIAV